MLNFSINQRYLIFWLKSVFCKNPSLLEEVGPVLQCIRLSSREVHGRKSLNLDGPLCQQTQKRICHNLALSEELQSSVKSNKTGFNPVPVCLSFRTLLYEPLTFSSNCVRVPKFCCKLAKNFIISLRYSTSLSKYS